MQAPPGFFVDVSWHPPNHRCSPKVQTPINCAARCGDSASREGARSGSKVRCAILVSHYMFIRYRKLISTDFSRAVSRPRSPVRAAATRDLDDTAPWLARWTMPCQGTLPLAQRTRLDRPSLALALPMQVQLFENCREGGRARQEHVATLGFAARSNATCRSGCPPPGERQQARPRVQHEGGAMLHRRRMMAAALAAIAIPGVADGQTPPPLDRPMPPQRTGTQPPRPGWTHHWRRSRGHWRWNGQRWVWVREKRRL